MHARIGRVSYAEGTEDQVVSHVRENIVPKYEETEGFAGFRLLLDRAAGEGIGISFWESEEAMRATENLGDQARQGAADAGSGSDKGVEHFEVMIDTLT